MCVVFNPFKLSVIRVSIWGSECVVVFSLSNSSHRDASFESAIIARRGARGAGGAATGEEGGGGRGAKNTREYGFDILAGCLHSSANGSFMLFLRGITTAHLGQVTYLG